MTQTINGYPIIASHDTPKAPMTRAGRVIMVDRGADSYERYVTAWQGRDGGVWDSSWCHGHYFESRFYANRDFNSRVDRGY